MGVEIIRRTLFHGSSVWGITKLNTAEETIVGREAYLASLATDVIGYARVRAGENSQKMLTK